MMISIVLEMESVVETSVVAVSVFFQMKVSELIIEQSKDHFSLILNFDERLATKEFAKRVFINQEFTF